MPMLNNSDACPKPIMLDSHQRFKALHGSPPTDNRIPAGAYAGPTAHKLAQNPAVRLSERCGIAPGPVHQQLHPARGRPETVARPGGGDGGIHGVSRFEK